MSALTAIAARRDVEVDSYGHLTYRSRFPNGIPAWLVNLADLGELIAKHDKLRGATGPLTMRKAELESTQRDIAKGGRAVARQVREEFERDWEEFSSDMAEHREKVAAVGLAIVERIDEVTPAEYAALALKEHDALVEAFSALFDALETRNAAALAAGVLPASNYGILGLSGRDSAGSAKHALEKNIGLYVGAKRAELAEIAGGAK